MKLKKWMTVKEAAQQLSSMLDEELSPADVIDIALDYSIAIFVITPKLNSRVYLPDYSPKDARESAAPREIRWQDWRSHDSSYEINSTISAPSLRRYAMVLRAGVQPEYKHIDLPLQIASTGCRDGEPDGLWDERGIRATLADVDLWVRTNDLAKLSTDTNTENPNNDDSSEYVPPQERYALATIIEDLVIASPSDETYFHNTKSRELLKLNMSALARAYIASQGISHDKRGWGQQTVVNKIKNALEAKGIAAEELYQRWEQRKSEQAKK